MNNIALESASADAICMWGIDHVEGCILSLHGEIVSANVIPKDSKSYSKVLIISKHECQYGLTIDRWKAVGLELFEYQERSSSCRTHRKH